MEKERREQIGDEEMGLVAQHKEMPWTCLTLATHEQISQKASWSRERPKMKRIEAKTMTL